MLGRCLLLILSNTGKMTFLQLLASPTDPCILVGCSTATLFHAVQVLVRLSILPGPTTPKLDELLFQSLSQLIVLERNLRMTSSPNESPSWNPDWDRSKPQLPPHTSRTLWHCIDHDPLWTWGKCVEGLWRVSMASLKKGAVWDALTCRLLLWRGIVGESRTLEGEWARCEVIRNMNEFH